MIRFIVAILLASGGMVLDAANCEAKSTNVRGYYRKDGTYVRPHTRNVSGGGAASSFVPRTEYRTTYRDEARTESRSSAVTRSIEASSRLTKIRETFPSRTTAAIVRDLTDFIQEYEDTPAAAEARRDIESYESKQRQLERDGAAKLAAIRARSESVDAATARSQLTALVTAYPGTQAAATAESLILDINRAQAAQDAETSVAMLTEAKRLQADGDLNAAEMKLIEIGTRFPNRAAADEAARLLTALREVRAQNARNEKLASEKLRLAKGFLSRGQTANARKWLTDLIKMYPGTAAAKEGESELQKL